LKQQTSIWKSIFSAQGAVMLFTGFSSGLPLLLTGRTLQVWMTESQVDLKTTSLSALFGLPYVWKFLWAPFFDRYKLPFLGLRRGWLVVIQACLIASLFWMSVLDPKAETLLLAAAAVLVSFFSASQDTLLDAYRREYLPETDLALGTSIFAGGYRIAMWIAGAGALLAATVMPWPDVIRLMALGVVFGIITTLVIREPTHRLPPPPSLLDSFWLPLKDFVSRDGAWFIILFILLFKIGDNMAGNILNPFYLKIGYTKEQIAFWAKSISLFTSVFGGLIGGIVVKKVGLVRGLVLFGVLQALSTAAFALLAGTEHNIWLFGGVIGFEDLTSGMGSAAFLAFMAKLTNTRFSATQYALLSGLAALPNKLFASAAGYFAEMMGWVPFFLFCALIAIPGILMIFWMQRYQQVSTSNDTTES
jgi:PAT family beta-lactamase induction signal transducer AmpG